ncbi:MAG: hypothetical protein LBV67_10800 [Streptococcaceae bacterium]|nr:hypothetical protein [Streptococcaceae bacterium]
MRKINLAEILWYLLIVILALVDRIIGKTPTIAEMYYYIVGIHRVVLIHIPFFTYLLMRSYLKISRPAIIVRYKSVSAWTHIQLKSLAKIGFRSSIILNLIITFFLASVDISFIWRSEYLMFVLFSLVAQTMGLMLIGILYLNLTNLSNVKFAFVQVILIFLALSSLMRNLTQFAFKDLLLPIWDAMYFYEMKVDVLNDVKYILINIALVFLLQVCYKKYLKQKDWL